MKANQKHQLSTALINAETQILHLQNCLAIHTELKFDSCKDVIDKIKEAKQTLDSIPTELDFKIDETFLSDVHSN